MLYKISVRLGATLGLELSACSARQQLCLFFVAATACVPSAAIAFCSKPDAPYCISSSLSLDDESGFHRCRSDMQFYISEVGDYLDCLKREAQETVVEENGAIRKFNCHANGNTACF
jgi:hypothetical protein